MKFKDKLKELDACSEAVEWVGNKGFKKSWETCQRGDWMLWLAKTLDCDLRQLTLAKARCAKLVIHLMKDERSRNAVKIAEQYGLGEATRKQLDAAAAAAYDAYDAAYDAAADAADAADAAYDAAADAAAAAYAAAAYDADDAAYEAAAADADAAYDAYKETYKKCADICRKAINFKDLKI